MTWKGRVRRRSWSSIRYWPDTEGSDNSHTIRQSQYLASGLRYEPVTFRIRGRSSNDSVPLQFCADLCSMATCLWHEFSIPIYSACVSQTGDFGSETRSFGSVRTAGHRGLCQLHAPHCTLANVSRPQSEGSAVARNRAWDLLLPESRVHFRTKPVYLARESKEGYVVKCPCASMV